MLFATGRARPAAHLCETKIRFCRFCPLCVLPPSGRSASAAAAAQAELRLLESDDELTREAAVHAARELLRCQRERVSHFTEHVMLR